MRWRALVVSWVGSVLLLSAHRLMDLRKGVDLGRELVLEILSAMFWKGLDVFWVGSDILNSGCWIGEGVLDTRRSLEWE